MQVVRVWSENTPSLECKTVTNSKCLGKSVRTEQEYNDNSPEYSLGLNKLPFTCSMQQGYDLVLTNVDVFSVPKNLPSCF